MSAPKTARPRSLMSDMVRMSAVLSEAMYAHEKHRYKRCRQKLYELSVVTSEYSKKG